ncbi:hypothetical protein [Nonomuraea sp. NPDC023979]|uniref:hypothetical protein n=1 Tax=Nonomuraea sp. NPDC023979 TaxID=3154796 RepID=UPI0033D78373
MTMSLAQAMANLRSQPFGEMSLQDQFRTLDTLTEGLHQMTGLLNTISMRLHDEVWMMPQIVELIAQGRDGVNGMALALAEATEGGRVLYAPWIEAAQANGRMINRDNLVATQQGAPPMSVPASLPNDDQ